MSALRRLAATMPQSVAPRASTSSRYDSLMRAVEGADAQMHDAPRARRPIIARAVNVAGSTFS